MPDSAALKLADDQEFEGSKAEFLEWSETQQDRWEQETIQTFEAELQVWMYGRAKARERDEEFNEPRPTLAEVEQRFVDNAIDDLNRLEAEIDRMQVRSGILLTISGAFFLIYNLKPGNLSSAWGVGGLISIAIALVVDAIAFAWIISPLAPPFQRSREPYDKRTHRTLLPASRFLKWTHLCWLSERRTPVIQKYKRAHAWAVRLMKWAAIGAIPGIVLGIFIR